MKIIRTRFKEDIVAEVGVPTRNSRKVMIICGGMPGAPSKRQLIEFFVKKGYWTIFPRYRGSWESGGTFLRVSPMEDIREVMDALPQGFEDLWSGDTYAPSISTFHLLATSFGGPAGMLLSKDERVSKVIAVSPVVDWRAPSKAEPLDWLEHFVRSAFGEGYRFSKQEWKKLARGNFYNPATSLDSVDGKKIFIIHAKDDESVLWRPVAKFAGDIGAKLKLYKTGGHLSSSILTRPAVWRQARSFLLQK